MLESNENIADNFFDESTRCKECGQFPPDHGPACPNDPALNAFDPIVVLAELEVKLEELECEEDPDFEAIADLAARIESIRSHVHPAQ